MKSVIFALGLLAVSPFPFSFFKQAPGGAPPGAPTFNSELSGARGVETSSNATTVITVPVAGVAVGKTLVIAVTFILTGTQSLVSGSVTDAAGNTYAQRVTQNDGSTFVHLYSGYVATGLTSGQAITITWTNPSFSFRMWNAFIVDDAASTGQPDVTGNMAFTFGTAISAPATTVAANTCMIGVVNVAGIAATYGSGSWTSSGAVHTIQSDDCRNYYVYRNATSAGSQDPGGTLSGNQTAGVVWVALK